MYIFPYESIKFGSKIIIYGFGNVGYDYVVQLKKNKYADIIFILDKNAQYKNCLEENNVDILKPEAIYKLPQCYDYIIIAIENREICKIIQKKLIDNGIKESKIIISPINKIVDNLNSAYNLEEFKNHKTRIEIFSDFWANSCGKIEYLKYIYNEIKLLKDKEKKKLFNELIIDINSLKDKILLIRIFMQAGYLDSSMLKLIIVYANHILNLETRYMLLSDIALYPVHFGKAIYKGFFEEMHRSYKNLVVQYKLRIPDKKEKKGKRAAILISALYNVDEYSMVVRHAKKTQKQGYEVCIICLDIRKWYEGISFIKPYDDCYCQYSSKKFEVIHRKCFGNKIKIKYIDGESILERMQNSIDIIFGFNPSIILDMSDELAPQSYIFNQFFDVYYYPWRMQCSSMFFKKLMVTSKKRAYQYTKYYNNYKLNLQEYSFDFLEPLPKRRHFRSDYLLKDNDYVMVTVGKRLNTEMEKSFIDDVCQLIYNHINTVWLLVGIDSNYYIKTRYKDLVIQNKIIFMQYEEDIAGLFEICNIYVNPPRTGGGRSIRSAIQMKIPVVINDEILSDAVGFVDDKCIAQNQKEQMRILERYICNFEKGRTE